MKKIFFLTVYKGIIIVILNEQLYHLKFMIFQMIELGGLNGSF